MVSGESFDEYVHEIDRGLHGRLHEYVLYCIGLGGMADGFTYGELAAATPYEDERLRTDVDTLEAYDVIAGTDDPIRVTDADGFNDILDDTVHGSVEAARFTADSNGDRYIERCGLDSLRSSLTYAMQQDQ
jgi:hypothetical protein